MAQLTIHCQKCFIKVLIKVIHHAGNLTINIYIYIYTQDRGVTKNMLMLIIY